METARTVLAEVTNTEPTITSGVSQASSIGALVYLSFAAATGVTTDYHFANEIIPLPAVEEAEAGNRLEERRAWQPVAVAIGAFPFEDGMDHPAEDRLRRFVSNYRDTCLFGLLQDARDQETDLFAKALRLLSRNPGISRETRRQFVESGLDSDTIDVRDAAMQAVENWKDRSLVPLLAAHHEPVAWLADYQQGLIEDLRG